MRADQMFQEEAAEEGHSSLVAEAHKFAEKLRTTLSLKHTDPSCNSHKSSEVLIQRTKIKAHLMKAALISYKRTSRQKSGTGICLLLDGKTCAPTHVIVGAMELYEHLTPSRAYTSYKTGNAHGGGGGGGGWLCNVQEVHKSCRDLLTCFIGVFRLSWIKVFKPIQCRVENAFLRNM